jgi:mRNA-degrading endonuclease toxin of MazEF toxin-antitoxin module
MGISRFEVHLVKLDPTVGSEIRKTRPCLVISPNELNRFSKTLIVAPMTTKGKTYPTRVACRFGARSNPVSGPNSAIQEARPDRPQDCRTRPGRAPGNVCSVTGRKLLPQPKSPRRPFP